MVASTLRVFDFDEYILVNLGANLSFVTPYLALRFDICPKIFLDLFLIYTPIDDSILSKKVYRDCPE